MRRIGTATGVAAVLAFGASIAGAQTVGCLRIVRNQLGGNAGNR